MVECAIQITAAVLVSWKTTYKHRKMTTKDRARDLTTAETNHLTAMYKGQGSKEGQAWIAKNKRGLNKWLIKSSTIAGGALTGNVTEKMVTNISNWNKEDENIPLPDDENIPLPDDENIPLPTESFIQDTSKPLLTEMDKMKRLMKFKL